MTRRTTAALLTVIALLAAGCGGGDEEGAGGEDTTTTETTATETDTGGEAAGTVLRGTVGPGFTIELTTADGQPVETLPPGSYTVEVDDRAPDHNFHLTGPGVDVQTDVPEEGAESFDVQLQAGEYTFVCDPHASSMRGSFEVSG
ncbi:MAG TPA: plastocyanin/azurin family copper-binding protein [Gaiellaceae bacterium]|nr:plastocyanin/azurin family copper-binding protein [Gaiellaceae bacterium]